MRLLDAWLGGDRDARRFPYPEVLAGYHRGGKHFIDQDLLATLIEVRARLGQVHGPTPTVRQLAAFLSTALDKADGRYDYQTYLALCLLPMPNLDEGVTPEVAGRQRDRLVVNLIADLLRFELDAASGATDLLAQQRPNAALVAKRLRLGVRAALPALRRIGLADLADPSDQAARHLSATVHADLTGEERQVLSLSMLPVYTVHDEYLFIRVLQSWETTFALLAIGLSEANSQIAAGDGTAGAHYLRAATSALRESSPLFSLVATMQVQSFHTFREWTEGASAIQSRNYKTVESLCRVPDQMRLDSLAYTAVPEVRQRVLAGRPTIEQSYRAAVAAGHLSLRERDLVEQAMRDFAGAMLHWRQTHFRLAMRMLGGRSGTGYTEGTPYLDAVRKIPTFDLPQVGINPAASSGTDQPPKAELAQSQ